MAVSTSDHYMPINVSAGSTKQGVRRCLFGAPTQEDMEALQDECDKANELANKDFINNYNFDVSRDEALPGSYVWEQVPTESVPAFYSPKLVSPPNCVKHKHFPRECQCSTKKNDETHFRSISHSLSKQGPTREYRSMMLAERMRRVNDTFRVSSSTSDSACSGVPATPSSPATASVELEATASGEQSSPPPSPLTSACASGMEQPATSVTAAISPTTTTTAPPQTTPTAKTHAAATHSPTSSCRSRQTGMTEFLALRKRRRRCSSSSGSAGGGRPINKSPSPQPPHHHHLTHITSSTSSTSTTSSTSPTTH